MALISTEGWSRGTSAAVSGRGLVGQQVHPHLRHLEPGSGEASMVHPLQVGSSYANLQLLPQGELGVEVGWPPSSPKVMQEFMMGPAPRWAMGVLIVCVA